MTIQTTIAVDQATDSGATTYTVVVPGTTPGTANPAGQILDVQGHASGVPIPASDATTHTSLATIVTNTGSLAPGASTAALQTTGNNSLASLVTGLATVNSELITINTTLGGISLTGCIGTFPRRGSC